MPDKIVELKTGRPSDERIVETSQWYAPIEIRITQIERLVNRLEWQVWIVLCGVSILVLLSILERLAKAQGA